MSAHAEAQRLRLDGKLLDARAQLLVCAQPECPKLVAGDCTLWLGEVESSLSSIVLAVEGEGGRDLVEVRVFANERLLTERTDGRALALDPGSYEFRFEAAGHEPRTVAASIRQSEKNRIVRVQLAPIAGAANRLTSTPETHAPPAPEDGSSVPLATYVLGGVSLASFGTSAFFFLTGKEKYDELAGKCGQTRSCSEEQVEPGKRAYLIAYVALGVGIASAAAATIAYFVAADSGQDTPPEPSASLQAIPLDGGAYVQWTLRR